MSRKSTSTGRWCKYPGLQLHCGIAYNFQSVNLRHVWFQHFSAEVHHHQQARSFMIKDFEWMLPSPTKAARYYPVFINSIRRRHHKKNPLPSSEVFNSCGRDKYLKPLSYILIPMPDALHEHDCFCYWQFAMKGVLFYRNIHAETGFPVVWCTMLKGVSPKKVITTMGRCICLWCPLDVSET